MCSANVLVHKCMHVERLCECKNILRVNEEEAKDEAICPIMTNNNNYNSTFPNVCNNKGFSLKTMTQYRSRHAVVADRNKFTPDD